MGTRSEEGYTYFFQAKYIFNQDWEIGLYEFCQLSEEETLQVGVSFIIEPSICCVHKGLSLFTPKLLESLT